MKTYNKLVRDKIPEIIIAQGKKCKTRVLVEIELQEQLLLKLREEVAEFEKEPSVEELADIVEVLMSLAERLGSDIDEVEEVRFKKHKDRGGFKKSLFLEYVE